MKLLLQIGIVLGVCLAGGGISAALPFPFPASLVSMLLIFALLLSGLLKPDHIRQKADFLLSNMVFFFLPAGVALMENYGAIRSELVAFILICAVTTVLTFGATAWTVRAVAALQKKFGRRGRDA